MVRDYTDEVYQRMLKQIEEINDSQWSWLTDKLGDLCTTGGRWLGLIKIKDDMSNIESYQKKVLDEHDTTVEELDKIFADVKACDEEYGGHFRSECSNLEPFTTALANLANAINPDSNVSVGTMANMVSGLDNAADGLNSNFETVLDKRQKQLEEQARKETIHNVIKVVGGVCGVVGAIATGNVVKAVTGAVKVVNDSVALGSDIAALNDLNKADGKSGVDRYKQLQHAEKMLDQDNVADLLENQGFPDGVVKAAKVVSTGAAVVNAVSSLEDGWEAIKTGDLSTNLGFKTAEAGKSLAIWDHGKNIANGAKYVEVFWSDDPRKELFDLVGTGNDAVDMVDKCRKAYDGLSKLVA